MMNVFKVVSTLFYFFVFLSFGALLISPEPRIFFALFIAVPVAVVLLVISLLRSGQAETPASRASWYEHF